MSFTTKAANLAHKTVVVTALSVFSWQGYQMGSMMLMGTENKKTESPHAGFFQMLRDKYAEEYEKYFDTGHRDWYDRDDDSYLKNAPRPRDYQPGGKGN